MRRSTAAQITTAVHFEAGWIKLIQAESSGQGQARLLGMKARQMGSFSDEGAMSAALKELLRTLPVSPKEVVGLLSTGEVLTRYLSLPSENPQELKAMALYQLEGLLPFPIQECVTSVKVLGSTGEATRVLAAAAHRRNVERLIRVCKAAGLELVGIATSSEAIGNWHRACWPHAAVPPPRVWLVAEITPEGLDMGVLVNGSLVYMRQILAPATGLEDLAAKLQETVRAYAKEQVGPAVEQITLSGSLPGFEHTPVERLEEVLRLPVGRVDPLEASPFRETLSVTAQDLSPEVSFSELLGAVCLPRLLELDLLPVEIRQEQASRIFFQQLQKTALLSLVGLAVILSWAGIKIGGTEWLSHQLQEQSQALMPPVGRVKAMVEAIRDTLASRREYAFQMDCLKSCAKNLSPQMTLQFLGMQSTENLTLRGTAPDLNQVTGYAMALGKEPLWKNVALQSAKVQRTGDASVIEFEMLLEPRKGDASRSVPSMER